MPSRAYSSISISPKAPGQGLHLERAWLHAQLGPCPSPTAWAWAAQVQQLPIPLLAMVAVADRRFKMMSWRLMYPACTLADKVSLIVLEKLPSMSRVPLIGVCVECETFQCRNLLYLVQSGFHSMTATSLAELITNGHIHALAMQLDSGGSGCLCITA